MEGTTGLRRLANLPQRTMFCLPGYQLCADEFCSEKMPYQAVPCRHIPLNEIGETLDSLYRTGTNEEIEQTLQSWLLETIQQLEEPSEELLLQEAA
jgi:hypothetical protein